jgi:hypothetical protein
VAIPSDHEAAVREGRRLRSEPVIAGIGRTMDAELGTGSRAVGGIAPRVDVGTTTRP